MVGSFFLKGTTHGPWMDIGTLHRRDAAHVAPQAVAKGVGVAAGLRVGPGTTGAGVDAQAQHISFDVKSSSS